ncbi:MFS transporter [Cellulomonas chengniuliangii]|uniref:MFS transporter n=1 Tax=Cellulomonas chengniuliangii TaxID=2968084 RepID=A0ABY5L1Y3_9CELL|nr:MFS transporter [Cellulomonas chengniuliangii]MCC2307783.1 MFS transporter [Cellulomonas chengniuliangii]UUI75460.1 MFS transporter [Cellulomonas chengniuliangii]
MTAPSGSTPPTGALATNTSPWRGAHRIVTVGLVALASLSAFEALAVSTAMPTVAAALDGFSLYAMAFAAPIASGVVGMTVAGLWADRRGPGPALVWGVVLFVAGVLVAGLAHTMPMLVVGRVVQGIGSGLETVAMYVVVARAYPAAVRPRVFAAFAAAWVIPGVVGPLIAGLMVEHLGWRWVFLAVPALAIPALLAVRPALAGLGPAPRDAEDPEDEDAPAEPRGRTGPRRLLLLSVVAATAVIALHHGGQQSGASAVVWIVVAGAALVVGLPPLLPVGTLRSGRGLPTVILLRGLMSAAFFGGEVFLPLLLQTRHSLSPSGAGAVLTFAAVTWSLGSAVRGRATGWKDTTFLRGGTLGMAAGIVLAALLVAPATPVALGYAGWALAGFGIGLAMPTTSVLTLQLSAPAEQGSNSSALQIMDSVATALALALAGSLFTALGGESSDSAFVAGFAVAAAIALLGTALSGRVLPARGLGARPPAPGAVPGRTAPEHGSPPLSTM